MSGPARISAADVVTPELTVKRAGNGFVLHAFGADMFKPEEILVAVSPEDLAEVVRDWAQRLMAAADNGAGRKS